MQLHAGIIRDRISLEEGNACETLLTLLLVDIVSSTIAASRKVSKAGPTNFLVAEIVLLERGRKNAQSTDDLGILREPNYA